MSESRFDVHDVSAGSAAGSYGSRGTRVGSFETPVVLIVFNRPDVTRRVLAAIREAKPSVLFVVADGPRANREGERERCRAVRDLVSVGVDWECEVKRNYSETNLGCARRVASGLDWVFGQVEEAIILEDDCVPDASFFPFCEELLARYRYDNRISLIAGCNFQADGVSRGGGGSYYFSRYLHCWGWASWRRAWTAYDHDLRSWHDGEAQRWLRKQPWMAVEKRWWRHVLAETSGARIDTWDFPFVWPHMMAGRLGIVAQPNLVTNIGFGPEATHTVEPSEWMGRTRHAMGWPLVHSKEVEADRVADEFTARGQFSRMNLVFRAVRFIWRRLRGACTNGL